MNTNLKLNKNLIKSNQVYLQIFNHLNRNYYHEMVLLNIKISDQSIGFFIFQICLEDFHFFDNEPFDNSIVRRDYFEKISPTRSEFKRSRSKYRVHLRCK